MTFDNNGNRSYRLLCKSQILLNLLQCDLEAYSKTNEQGPFHTDKLLKVNLTLESLCSTSKILWKYIFYRLKKVWKIFQYSNNWVILFYVCLGSFEGWSPHNSAMKKKMIELFETSVIVRCEETATKHCHKRITYPHSGWLPQKKGMIKLIYSVFPPQE